jgi:hypothetical protein
MNRVLAVVAGAAAGAGIVGGVVWFATRKGALGAVPIPAEAVATHIRQIRRYGFAASQDKSPVVGLTHASYALVLLDTLEEIVGKDAVNRSGVDAGKIRKFITAQQDKHAEALKRCDPHLQQVLALERREGKQLPGFVVAGAGAAPRGA